MRPALVILAAMAVRDAVELRRLLAGLTDDERAELDPEVRAGAVVLDLCATVDGSISVSPARAGNAVADEGGGERENSATTFV